MKILLTGGAGFIGHHITDYILKRNDWKIIILDRLDLSGNLNILTELDNFEINKSRVKFIWQPKIYFNESLKQIVKFTLKNTQWQL